MTRIYAALAATAVAGLLGGTAWQVWSSQSKDAFAECRGGAVGGGAIGGPFTLIDKTGTTVTDKDIITKPTLIYFGYTFCPDVCPLDSARNAEAIDILQEKGIDATPLFISVDPERDTPQVVGAYATNLHPRMIGLTGTDAQVKAASQAFKTYYKKQDSGDEFYMMDHSTFSYLVLPEVGFVEFFNRDDSAQKIADRAACFIAKS